MASRGRRVTRLRRPLLFVITPWVCGGFFVLVGAVTVVDAGGGSGVDLAASVAIGLGVGSVGAWFAYAFGWVPRMRIVVDALGSVSSPTARRCASTRAGSRAMTLRRCSHIRTSTTPFR